MQIARLSPALGAEVTALDLTRTLSDEAFAVRASRSYQPDVVENQDFDGQNRTQHPVVLRHPETGRKALFVNPGFTAAIAGFSPDESQALLDFLYAHATREEFIYRHRWRPGDLLVWDNRCVMHQAVTDYTADRYMHRTTVIADRPCA